MRLWESYCEYLLCCVSSYAVTSTSCHPPVALSHRSSSCLYDSSFPAFFDPHAFPSTKAYKSPDQLLCWIRTQLRHSSSVSTSQLRLHCSCTFVTAGQTRSSKLDSYTWQSGPSSRIPMSIFAAIICSSVIWTDTSTRVGVFSTLTNSFALVAVGTSENFFRSAMVRLTQLRDLSLTVIAACSRLSLTMLYR